MQKITYYKTSFNPQNKLEVEDYNTFKKAITKNPNFVIGDDSFFEIIQGYIFWAIISFVVMLIGFGLGEGITTVIGGFAMLSFIMSIIMIVLEVPSKSKAFKEMRKYYDKMKLYIANSNNYEEFINTFY